MNKVLVKMLQVCYKQPISDEEVAMMETENEIGIDDILMESYKVIMLIQ